MPNDIDCQRAGEPDVAIRYLAGRLTDAEAEAFERHYLSCDLCWTEVEQGARLRGAFGNDPVAGPTPTASGGRRDYWTPLAAAAVVALVAFGLARIAGTPGVSPPASPVLRGSGANRLALTVRNASAGEAVLEWRSDPEAATYRIQIMRADGVPVLTSETSDVTLRLDVGALPGSPDQAFVAKIEAIDALGRVVSTTDAVPLPRS
jgi:hypothetical protein